MALDGAWNAYIFREGKISLRGLDLANQLIQLLYRFRDSDVRSHSAALIDLLLRAGELECAFFDARSPNRHLLSAVSDSLAQCLVSGSRLRGEELARSLAAVTPPQQVAVAPPEGFAYYSLHPLAFADLANTVTVREDCAAVVGIRSIGTTLSAVVQAALLQRGIQTRRITVRPSGHPYDRRTEFALEDRRWIATMLSHGADFLVVDEGPGMSGSSFLSVGDALLSCGVPRSRIAFLGSRRPDPATLTARHAAERWPAYRSYCTRNSTHLPQDARIYIAGGIWRAAVFSDERLWPASWLQMERLKFLSPQRDVMFKFEGLGRFGQAVHARSTLVAEAGFGPCPIAFDQGFGIFPVLRAHTLFAADATHAVLQRIAEYCAFRSRAFAVPASSNLDLRTMLRFNVAEEFGAELPRELSSLELKHCVICDGRMLPHKWLYTSQGLLKVDSAAHGDDHFFPGPTDIAWDLAGVIVEWNLSPDLSQFFLDAFRRATGDDVRQRLKPYLLAYSIFRTAYCKMASASMEGSDEEHRLARAYHRYRAQAWRCLRRDAEPAAELKFRPTDPAPQLRIA